MCRGLLTAAVIAVSAAAPQTAQGSITVSGSYSNRSIAAVLIDLGRRFGVTISLEPGVDGHVTAELHDATLVEALDAVLKPLRLRYTRSGAVIVVSSAASSASAEVVPTSPPPLPAVLPLTNIQAAQAAAFLARIYPQSHIAIDTPANSLVVIDGPENVQAMRSLVAGMTCKVLRHPSLKP